VGVSDAGLAGLRRNRLAIKPAQSLHPMVIDRHAGMAVGAENGRVVREMSPC
jgi:hypothetical protein